MQIDVRPSVLSRLLGRKPAMKALPGQLADLDDVDEHPMSENAIEVFDQQIVEDKGLATELGEDGWSLLQQEALAGNLGPVRTLLKHGADPFAPNQAGLSAADLAALMGWRRVLGAFKPLAN